MKITYFKDTDTLLVNFNNNEIFFQALSVPVIGYRDETDFLSPLLRVHPGHSEKGLRFNGSTRLCSAR